MRTSVWLVRHGQTEANLARRYQSYSESPLTGYGEQQVAALAKRLRRIPFRLITSSPRVRTRMLAEAILAGRQKVEYRADPAWAEVSHGLWEGLTYAEVQARYPDQARDRWAAGIHGKAEGGESLAEAAERVGAAWQALLHEHTGGRIFIATHATPIQIVLCLSLGMNIAAHWNWRIDLGSLTSLDIYPSGVIVRMVNALPTLAD